MGCILIFVQPFGWQLHSLYQSLLQPVLFLSLFKKYSSYFWLLWVLVVACGNFIAPRRLLSSCDTGAQELPHTGLVAVGGMWDLSSPQFSSVLSLSRVRLFATPWTAARQASLSITNSRSSLISIESVMPSNHPGISSCVVPFSSCPQSLPDSESFKMSQLFTWGSQSTGVSASASFLPKNTQTDLL